MSGWNKGFLLPKKRKENEITPSVNNEIKTIQTILNELTDRDLAFMEYNKPMCIDCKTFYASINDKCSVCADPTKLIVFKQKKKNMSDDELNQWIETGIHSVNNEAKMCGICFEDKEPGDIISNFACLCHPVSCKTCNPLVSICPYCRMGKYLTIGKEEITAIVKENFSKKGLRLILKKAILQKYASPLQMKQVICFAKDIDDVVVEQNLWKDYNALHSLYCLAPDFARTKHRPQLSFVICYKGFDDERSYPFLIKMRLQTDPKKFMEFTGHFDDQPLQGVRFLAEIAEPEERERRPLDDNMMRQLTSGQPIYARHLYSGNDDLGATHMNLFHDALRRDETHIDQQQDRTIISEPIPVQTLASGQPNFHLHPHPNHRRQQTTLEAIDYYVNIFETEPNETETNETETNETETNGILNRLLDY